MSGWIKLHRGWMDSHTFTKEPFTEREAWLWIVESAAYESHTRHVNGHAIDLSRGQMIASQRTMAEVWKWGRQRVRGFIAKLELLGSLTQNSTHGLTQITVCNYEKYQGEQPNAQPASNPAATQQQPIKEEGKEIKKERNTPLPPKGIDIPDWIPADAWAGFREMRKAIKKPMTDRAANAIIAKLDGWRALGQNIEKILDASTVNGWQDVYLPKGSLPNGGPKPRLAI